MRSRKGKVRKIISRLREFSLLGFLVFIWLKLMNKEIMVTGRCNGCGACCKSLCLDDGEGWVRSEEAFFNFVQQEGAFSCFQIIGRDAHGFLLFRCDHLDEYGKCRNYEKRFMFCRNFPDKNLLFCGGKLPKGCGYQFKAVKPFLKILEQEIKVKDEKVLILEPYFGGSHKSFLEGLQKNVAADYTIMTLPARKWKMRMQLSAQWFVSCVARLPLQDRWFDSVLCSTFIDLAVFKALICTLEGWNKRAKLCLYFHENQFAYPNRLDDKSVYQFTSINFNSALVADSLAFNSEFNRSSLLEGCRKYLKCASDMKMGKLTDSIEKKSRVLYPGVDLDSIDNVRKKDAAKSPVIVWNHRWEHDKNPEEFFSGLYKLQEKGLQFKLIVLGESFQYSPPCFETAKKELEREILHFGYTPSYRDYCRKLSKGSIVISTARHEFYGIAVIEAVRAGCFPLLPDRLSYPELFPDKYLYKEGDFLPRLETAVRDHSRISQAEARILTEKTGWRKLRSEYEKWLLQ